MCKISQKLESNYLNIIYSFQIANWKPTKLITLSGIPLKATLQEAQNK